MIMTTTVDVLAGDLPAELVAVLDALHDDAPSQPTDEIPDIEVEVDYTPGWYQAGCRSGHPDNWTPDEGEDPEIITVTTVEGGIDIVDALTKKQIESLILQAVKDQEQQAEDAFEPPDDYYDDDPTW